MEPGQLIDWLIKGITGLIAFLYLKNDKELKDTRTKFFAHKTDIQLAHNTLKSDVERIKEKHSSDLEQVKTLFNLKIDQLAENMNTKIDEINRAILHAEKNSIQSYNAIAELLKNYQKNK